MIDLRPVGYVIGWLVAAFGVSMIAPLLADLTLHAERQMVFAYTAIVTTLAGAAMVLSCANADVRSLTIQQSFLFACGIWVVFPLFGAAPFVLGEPGAGVIDALFESMSALTTTGGTVFNHLETLPPGTLLWRGQMQWFGGLGIVVVAIVFLPTLKVGGMQFFRSEAFDTLGKILPRATEIALSLTSIYLLTTVGCIAGYLWTGMTPFDALVHAFATVSTGGMANYDASFGQFGAGAQYVCIVFMLLAALPFVRYIQLVAGSARPLLTDSQVHAFFALIGVFVLALVWRLTAEGVMGPLEATRHALFNVVSIISGTGFATVDYGGWGSFAVTLFFVLGLIGGCSGSTACSVKVFRYQLLISAVAAEVRRLHSPNRVILPRYQGRPVDDETMSSVMAFFMLFYLSLGILTVLLVLLGLEPLTAISAAATALANVGPGLGPEIGPAGNFSGLNDAAKALLTVAMLLGRLELLSVLVILTPAFWRA